VFIPAVSLFLSVIIVIVCVKIWQAMKRNCLPVKKKIHITPVQQMLNRLEAMQKKAAVKQSSGTDTDVAVKHSTSHADSKVSNTLAVHNSAKIPCATQPKLGQRVAHKPVPVRLTDIKIL